LVPDNLKSGVHKASFYDPEINRSYGAMAAHYGVGILPARPYHPKDKAKVEAGVRIAQFYVLGRLRNLTFFSLAECNAAIADILVQLNGRVMRRLGVSRRELFETVERPVMRPLPDTDHEYAEWAFARVGIDYHVEVAGFFYSVPYSLIRQGTMRPAGPGEIAGVRRRRRHSPQFMSWRLQGWRVQAPAVESIPPTMHSPWPFQTSTSDADVPLNLPTPGARESWKDGLVWPSTVVASM
jgi:hypothetical protein